MSQTPPYPAAADPCAYRYKDGTSCTRPAWSLCADGFCLYHSPHNGEDPAIARQVWQKAREMAADEVAQEADFRGWQFPEDPDQGYSPREDGCLGGFSRTRFASDALFDGATFSAHARFDGATFGGDAGFDGATFSGGAWVRDAMFNGDVRFSGAKFRRDALFGGAKFCGDARFGGATFRGQASFAYATFSGETSFGHATFGGDAWFRGVTFSGIAWFEDATFSGLAWFVDATLSRGALFRGATFSEVAGFHGAKFSEVVRFERARFGGTAWFDRAQFEADALFSGALFEADAGFNSSRFGPACNIMFNTSHPRPFRHPRHGESAYRFAKQAAQARGEYGEAGRYHYAEQCAIEHRCLDEGDATWLFRAVFGHLIFGYGERAGRPLLFGLAVILVWAGLYVGLEAVSPGNGADAVPAGAHAARWGEALHFSVVTFTTLGYGDFKPKPGYRWLADLEALFGASLMAVFIVALTRKYMR